MKSHQAFEFQPCSDGTEARAPLPLGGPPDREQSFATRRIPRAASSLADVVADQGTPHVFVHDDRLPRWSKRTCVLAMLVG